MMALLGFPESGTAITRSLFEVVNEQSGAAIVHEPPFALTVAVTPGPTTGPAVSTVILNKPVGNGPVAGGDELTPLPIMLKVKVLCACATFSVKISWDVRLNVASQRLTRFIIFSLLI